MRTYLLSIWLALLLGGHASAVELTHALTPELAAVHAVRLVVHTSPGGPCDLPKSKMVVAAKQALGAAGIDAADGFEPGIPDRAILEVYIDALELLRKCYLTVKVILRAEVGGAKVEGNNDYGYQMVWGDVGDYVFPTYEFVHRASELLRSRLRLMIAAIKRARVNFPDL